MQVVAKMVKHLTPEDMAWYVRPIDTKAGKQELMRREGIPWIVQYLIMLPACRKYEKRYTAPLEEVIAGREDVASGREM